MLVPLPALFLFTFCALVFPAVAARNPEARPAVLLLNFMAVYTVVISWFNPHPLNEGFIGIFLGALAIGHVVGLFVRLVTRRPPPKEGQKPPRGPNLRRLAIASAILGMTIVVTGWSSGRLRSLRGDDRIHIVHGQGTMMNGDIGLYFETTEGEYRVPTTPESLAKIIERGFQLILPTPITISKKTVAVIPAKFAFVKKGVTYYPEGLKIKLQARVSVALGTPPGEYEIRARVPGLKAVEKIMNAQAHLPNNDIRIADDVLRIAYIQVYEDEQGTFLFGLFGGTIFLLLVIICGISALVWDYEMRQWWATGQMADWIKRQIFDD